MVLEIEKNRLACTVDEAADLLSISRSLAYNAVERGEIKTVRLGRRLIVPLAELRRLLEPDNSAEDVRPSE